MPGNRNRKLAHNYVDCRLANYAVNVIVKNPDILGGTPVFRGTRVTTQTLSTISKAGKLLRDFLLGFPTVPRESAVAALEEAERLWLARPLNAVRMQSC